ncbi:TrbI/VirB10 family protein [Bartonella choladocola]|uniref:Type IV secretion system protein VirB10 n=1 Tax=Bartonella choladocola TaxID=2750995 RepID=A0A1U9MJX5_9HYPH|nr:TrbI/VirB10 family protein [Bartonella choladocola]AQT48020.1 type IV secretion system protein VirB10 [Bartonella choladocola]
MNEDDYRKLAESTEPETGEKRANGRRLSAPILVGGTIVAIAFVWHFGNTDQSNRRLTDPENEQFYTGQFVPPKLPEEKPKEDEPTHVEIKPDVAPAPPPPPPPPLPPTAPPPIGDNTAEVDDGRWERLRSPMIVMSEAGSVSSAQKDSEKTNSSPQSDANVAFLDEQAKKTAEISIAGKIKRPDAMIVQGTMIRGTLNGAVHSDLPGNVKAVVEEDVWSLDGRRVLIPKGANLIGEYRSVIARGQTRVLIAWNRVIQSDGTSVALGSVGTDQLGRSGVEGKVDRHLLQRYGGASLLTLIGGGTQYLANYQKYKKPSSRTRIRIDPATGQSYTEYADYDDSGNEARELAARTFAQAIQDMASEEFRSANSIPDTIHIDQGTEIAVFVKKDLDFSQLYPDPVLEKYRELRNGK